MMKDSFVILASDEIGILCFIARELVCDNRKLLHDEIYNKYLFNGTMFLVILVVGGNTLESRPYRYWEGVRYPGWGEIS